MKTSTVYIYTAMLIKLNPSRLRYTSAAKNTQCVFLNTYSLFRHPLKER